MDYIGTDTDLTNIANAIRSTLDIDDQLEYPDDYIAAIGNMRGVGIDISGATVTLASSSFIYDGTEKTQGVASVVLNGQTLTPNVDYVVVGNKATNAGTHTISIMGILAYDGVATKNWSIAKAQGTISVNPNSVLISGVGETATSAITKTGDGNVTVSSSASNYISATVSGNTVTMTANAAGSATITVTLADGTNYLGATATISAITISNTLDNNSWSTISEVSLAGTGDLYWDVGDAKAVTLNGKVGDYCTLTNQTLYVFILGFNHKDNNVDDNNIMWGCFRSGTASNSVLAALYDSQHGQYKLDGTKTFNMNHWGNKNHGGWKACDLRYDILGATSTAPEGYGAERSTTNNVGYDATDATLTSPVADTLLAALPSDLRAIMRLRTHYCDNTGNKSSKAANVTSVVDAISLMMEFEVFGKRSFANPYEKDKQAQFTYFANGNSKKWYEYDSTGTEIPYCRFGSPESGDSISFCISSGGAISAIFAHYVGGVPAAFKT